MANPPDSDFDETKFIPATVTDDPAIDESKFIPAMGAAASPEDAQFIPAGGSMETARAAYLQSRTRRDLAREMAQEYQQGKVRPGELEEFYAANRANPGRVHDILDDGDAPVVEAVDTGSSGLNTFVETGRNVADLASAAASLVPGINIKPGTVTGAMEGLFGSTFEHLNEMSKGFLGYDALLALPAAGSGAPGASGEKLNIAPGKPVSKLAAEFNRKASNKQTQAWANMTSAAKLNVLEMADQVRTFTERAVNKALFSGVDFGPGVKLGDEAKKKILDEQLERAFYIELAKEGVKQGSSMFESDPRLGKSPYDVETDRETVEKVQGSFFDPGQALLPGAAARAGSRATQVFRALESLAPSAEKRIANAAGRALAVPFEGASKAILASGKYLEESPLLVGLAAAGGVGALGGSGAESALAFFLGKGKAGAKISLGGGVARQLSETAQALRGKIAPGPLGTFVAQIGETLGPEIRPILAGQLGMLPMALGTGSVEEAQAMVAGGLGVHAGVRGVFGGINGLHTARNLWSRERSAPGERMLPSETGDPGLDLAHLKVSEQLDNGDNNYVEGIRKFVKKTTGQDLVLLGEDDFATQLARLSGEGWGIALGGGRPPVPLSVGQVADTMRQAGVMLAKVDPTTGQTRYLALNKATKQTPGISVGHEAGHLLEYTMSPEEIAYIRKATRNAYSDEQILAYRHRYDDLAYADEVEGPRGASPEDRLRYIRNALPKLTREQLLGLVRPEQLADDPRRAAILAEIESNPARADALREELANLPLSLGNAPRDAIESYLRDNLKEVVREDTRGTEKRVEDLTPEQLDGTLSEVFAEHVNGILNSVPIAHFLPDGSAEKTHRDYSRTVYSFVDRALERIGAKQPKLVDGGSVIKTGTGMELSSRFGKTIENVLQAKALDQKVLPGLADDVSVPGKGSIRAPSAEASKSSGPLQNVRPVQPKEQPAVKRGDPVGDLRDANGMVVGEDAVISKVLPDDRVEVLFVDPDTGVRQTGEMAVADLPVSKVTPTVTEVSKGPASPITSESPTGATPAPGERIQRPATAADTVVPKAVQNVARPEGAPNLRATREQQDMFGEATPETLQRTVQSIDDTLPNRTPVQIEYLGAKSDIWSPNQVVREQQRLAADAADAVAKREGKPNPLRQVFDKIVVPMKWASDKKSSLWGWSMDKVIANLDFLRGWAELNPEARAVLDVKYLSGPDIASDLSKYLDNVGHGYQGTGEPVVLPSDARPGTVTPMDPNFTPWGIPEANARILNLLQGLEQPRTVTPGNLFARKMAAINGILPTVVIGLDGKATDQNPLRARLRNEFGFNERILNSALEQLRTNRIVSEVKARPDLNFRAGDTAAVQAGFMPQAFHGSPHDFDSFSTAKINTGEGNQTFGWGMYFASTRAIARWYENQLTQNRDAIQRLQQLKKKDSMAGDLQGRPSEWDTIVSRLKQNVRDKSGSLYEVDLKFSEADALDYNKSLGEQPEKIVRAVRKTKGLYEAIEELIREEEENDERSTKLFLDRTGREVYKALSDHLGSDEAASKALLASGIPALKYLDAGSRRPNIDPDDVAFNYVVFSDDSVSILKKDRKEKATKNVLASSTLSAELKLIQKTGAYDGSRPEVRGSLNDWLLSVGEDLGRPSKPRLEKDTEDILASAGFSGLLDKLRMLSPKGFAFISPDKASRALAEMEPAIRAFPGFSELVPWLSGTIPERVDRVKRQKNWSETDLAVAEWNALWHALPDLMEVREIFEKRTEKTEAAGAGDTAAVQVGFMPAVRVGKEKISDTGLPLGKEVLKDKKVLGHVAQTVNDGFEARTLSGEVVGNSDTEAGAAKLLSGALATGAKSGAKPLSWDSSPTEMRAALKKAVAKKEASLSPTAWILPDGTLAGMSSANNPNFQNKGDFHGEWLVQNGAKWGLESGDRLAALNKGFVRTRLDGATGRMGIEANQRFLKGRVLDKLLAQAEANLNRIGYLDINVFDDGGNVVRTEYIPLFRMTPFEASQAALSALTGKKRADLPFMPAKGRHVVESAIRLDDGTLFTGGTHWDAMERGKEKGFFDNEDFDDIPSSQLGFVDSRGKFLSRAEAAKLAVDSGQLDERGARKAIWQTPQGPALESAGFEEFRAFMPAAPNTPEFKKWFGDWEDPKAWSSRAKSQVSQVVDENRQPLRVYHSTLNDFTVFESGRTTKNASVFGSWDENRHGMFFSDDPTFSNEYVTGGTGRPKAGARTVPVYLDIKYPADFTRRSGREIAEEVGVNPNWTSHKETWELFDGTDGKKFVTALQEKGYDGAFMRETDENGEAKKTFVVFKPEQIKSATGNTGAFDASNPDIRFMPDATPDPEMRRIKLRAAVRTKDADALVFTGNIHYDAAADAAGSGAFSPLGVKNDWQFQKLTDQAYADPASSANEKLRSLYDSIEDGFVDEKGQFYTREEATALVNKPYLRQLDTMDVPQDQRFMPAAPRKDAKEWVGSAAIKFRDEITLGKNHTLIMDAMQEKYGPKIWEHYNDANPTPMDFGFVNNRGEFLSREDAMDLAQKAGQLDERTTDEATFNKRLDRPEQRDRLEAEGFEEGRAFMPDAGLYSGLEDTLSKIPVKATREQIEAALRDGVKEKGQLVARPARAEEMRDVRDSAGTSFEQFLKDRPDATREQMLDFVRENQVRTEETTLGERDVPEVEPVQNERGMWEVRRPDGSLYGQHSHRDDALASARRMQDRMRRDAPTKFEQYVLPGGENYGETILTLPKTEVPFARWLDEAKGMTEKQVLELPEDVQGSIRISYRQAVRDGYVAPSGVKPASGGYKSSHFPDVPNYLAHARHNERTTPAGEKVFFMEELQSDLHQKGRKEGYRRELTEAETAELVRLTMERRLLWGKYASEGAASRAIAARQRMTESELIAERELTSRILELEEVRTTDTPDAPFKKSWHELVFKKMLQKAVETGSDFLAWTTGEQQVNRYPDALRTVADKLDWGTLNEAEGTRSVYITKTGESVLHAVVRKDGTMALAHPTQFNGKNLSEAIGKSMASEVVSKNQGTIEGKDFTVGGEGMKGFYDKILPEFANKYLKRFGVRTETLAVDTPVRNKNDLYEASLDGVKVHAVKLTPELKAGVRGKGQPMYMPAPPVNSPEFKQWFGKSKVTDSAGNPKPLWHGTSAKFDAFDMDKARDGAHFFSEDASHAASFGKAEEYFVRLENPLEITQADLEARWDRDSNDGGESGVLPRDMVRSFVDEAKATGYDGLIVRKMADRDIEADTFLPFETNQIRRAPGDEKPVETQDLPPRVRAEAEKTFSEDWLNNAGGELRWVKQTIRPEDFVDEEASRDDLFMARAVSLAKDIKKNGLKNPVVVGPEGIEGRHRLAAAGLAGLRTIPAWVYRLEAEGFEEGRDGGALADERAVRPKRLLDMGEESGERRYMPAQPFAKDKATNDSFETRFKAIAEKDGEGDTFNADGTKTELKERPIVLTLGSLNQPAATAEAAKAKDYFNAHGVFLKNEHAKPGIFHFGDTVSADLNFVLPADKLELAKKFAKDNGQDSIFDARTFDVVKVGGSGQTILRTPSEFAVAARQLEDGSYTSIRRVQSEARAIEKARLDPRNSHAFKDLVKYLSPEEADGLRQDTAQNMVDVLKDATPEVEFEVAARLGKIKQGWYSRAAVALRTMFGEDTPKFVALLAATSPQQPVEKNFLMAAQIWNDWISAGRPLDNETLAPLIRNHANMSMRVPNSIRALRGEKLKDLTTAFSEVDADAQISGYKVESFRRNLLGNLYPVTNDTWIAKFAEVEQEIFKTRSGYLAITSRVRKVAKKLGMEPAEVQETVWSFFLTLQNAIKDGLSAKEVLSSLSEADLAKSPEFYDILHEHPEIQTELVKAGVLKQGPLGPDLDLLVDPAYAARRAAASGLPLAASVVEGVPGGQRVLARIAARAQRIKNAELAALADARANPNVVPEAPGEDPF